MSSLTDQASPQPKYLKDYTPPAFSIDKVHLTFYLDDTKTRVITHLQMKKESKEKALVLHGEKIKLLSLHLDGKQLSEEQYSLSETQLTLHDVPETFRLTIENEINPGANTTLEGLYKSKDIFCTQNEPKGFRKITYFLDRPDVMTSYTTKIIADKTKYPILLSNGNCVDQGDLPAGKHYVEWNDPHKKPCYLFALVAGDLDCLEDTFVRRSGKPVKLQIFCEKGVKDKCHHAMESLKKSMKWDEDVYNLEYDLDIFMIVAVDAFNAGAMENKGLNIFNTSCVLADEKSATDDNFIRVEKVIAHEYFHNWTGDRVTLRDWFQLTLKEGLTVFRDQEFTSDMNSRPVHRIENVSILRGHQFAEDAGPTAHPIRPPSYIEMNNFYTTTVYDKGSEIIRMVYHLVGKENFFRGMKKYFELYDGQAITCEDFIHAMELGSQKDLSQFMRWYDQKGTPHVKIETSYDKEKKQFTLKVYQSNPTEGENAPPLHFPLKLGLLDSQGNDYPIQEQVEIKEKEETFIFNEIDQQPTLSINREFSAPLILETPYTQKDYTFLMAHDSDDFNRWEASQELALKWMLEALNKRVNHQEPHLDLDYQQAFELLLNNPTLDYGLKTLALTLPSENTLGQKQNRIDFEGNHWIRKWLKKAFAKQNQERFTTLYHELQDDGPYQIDASSMGKRKLKNLCLNYLISLETPQVIDLAFEQFTQATNMTDEFAALAALNLVECPQREQALEAFYQKWKNDQLVMVKWLSLQALSPLKHTTQRVEKLLKSPVFDYKIPNLSRGLIGSFLENHIHFHAADGSGYLFFERQLNELDKINPQVAARLSTAFKKFPKLDEKRQSLMKQTLERLLNKKDLSKNTYEIVSKSLRSVSP